MVQAQVSTEIEHSDFWQQNNFFHATTEVMLWSYTFKDILNKRDVLIKMENMHKKHQACAYLIFRLWAESQTKIQLYIV